MTVLTTLILALFFCILPTPSKSDASPPHATIRGRLRLPDPNASLNSTRLTLNDGSLTTYTLPDGSFVFHRVPPGVHLLDVQSREHHFSQVKIQLLEEAMDAPKCVEYVYPGATKQAVPHPLELTAHASYQYYEPRDGFSILGIFKNPMLLMMVVMGGMMFMMPKMMENLDPDRRSRCRDSWRCSRILPRCSVKCGESSLAPVAKNNPRLWWNESHRRKQVLKLLEEENVTR